MKGGGGEYHKLVYPHLPQVEQVPRADLSIVVVLVRACS
jgi:hypothetical protein